MPRSEKKTVLLADDDIYSIVHFVDCLENDGYRVITASKGEDVLIEIKKRRGMIDVAVLDIRMPWEKVSQNMEADMLTGLGVARAIKKEYPHIKLIGFSYFGDKSVVDWFQQYGSGFLGKPVRESQLLDSVYYAIYGKRRRKPKCFIVHGRDEDTLLELKSFIQDDLQVDDVVILREQPNFGRTIIEKFEDFAKEIDIAFVLLTPDDVATFKKTPNSKKRRARQNVIFELGYFYAQLQRRKGRVVLLYKNQLELPSDISGIVYIDVSKGIRSNKEIILNELSEWF
jgi:CheY-like chemotaxis protein